MFNVHETLFIYNYVETHAGTRAKPLVLMASLYLNMHREALREIPCMPLACQHLQAVSRVAVLLIRALTKSRWTELLSEALKVSAFICPFAFYPEY